LLTPKFRAGTRLLVLLRIDRFSTRNQEQSLADTGYGYIHNTGSYSAYNAAVHP
jgi:hypothetical protein